MGIQSDLRDRLLSQPESFKKRKEYTLEKELGRGGFGKVVQALWRPQTGGQKQVALKMIRKDRLKKIGHDDEWDVMDEVKVLKGLDHANIVHLWDSFESRDKYYFTFELATGGDVLTRIATGGRFTEKDARNIIRGVAYLHSHNIFHRDIKPENILFLTNDPDSKVVIADFGIAKKLDHPKETFMEAAGTFEYFAPEILAQHPYGLKADVWAVGVLTYLFLCGYHPYAGSTARDKLFGMQYGTLRFQYEYWRRISMPAKDFCSKMLELEPFKRWTAAQAMTHPWIGGDVQSTHDLSRTIMDNVVESRSRWSKAINLVINTNRLNPAGETSTSSGSDNTASPTTPGVKESGEKRESLTDTSSSTATPPTPLTPLSMTEESDEENDASSFVTASERHSVVDPVPASRPAIQIKIGGRTASFEDSRAHSPYPDVPEPDHDKSPQYQQHKAGSSGYGVGIPSFGGLKGMMGRLKI